MYAGAARFGLGDLASDVTPAKLAAALHVALPSGYATWNDYLSAIQSMQLYQLAPVYPDATALLIGWLGVTAPLNGFTGSHLTPAEILAHQLPSSSPSLWTGVDASGYEAALNRLVPAVYAFAVAADPQEPWGAQFAPPQHTGQVAVVEATYHAAGDTVHGITQVIDGGRAVGVAGTYPGPGLLYRQADGSWQFVPVTQLTSAQLLTQFGDLPALDPALQVDPFDLPLPGAQFVYTYADGTVARSPWWNAYAALRPNAPGPTSTNIPAPMASAPANLYQSPNQPPPAPGTSQGSGAPVLLAPMYQPIATVPASTAPLPPIDQPAQPLYQSAASNGPNDNQPATAAAPAASGLSVSTVLLILVAVGAGAAYAGRHRSRGGGSWR